MTNEKNNVSKELKVLAEIRQELISIYSDPDQQESYLIANELLNTLEKLIWERMEEDEE